MIKIVIMILNQSPEYIDVFFIQEAKVRIFAI